MPESAKNPAVLHRSRQQVHLSTALHADVPRSRLYQGTGRGEASRRLVSTAGGAAEAAAPDPRRAFAAAGVPLIVPQAFWIVVRRVPGGQLELGRVTTRVSIAAGFEIVARKN